MKCGCLVVLSVIVWGPMFAFTIMSAFKNKPNPPTEATLRVSVGGYQPLFETTATGRSILPISEADLQDLRNSFGKNTAAGRFLKGKKAKDISEITFDGVSLSTWGINTDSLGQLHKDLVAIANGNFKGHFEFVVEVRFERHTDDQHHRDLMWKSPKNLTNLRLPGVREAVENLKENVKLASDSETPSKTVHTDDQHHRDLMWKSPKNLTNLRLPGVREAVENLKENVKPASDSETPSKTVHTDDQHHRDLMWKSPKNLTNLRLPGVREAVENLKENVKPASDSKTPSKTVTIRHAFPRFLRLGRFAEVQPVQDLLKGPNGIGYSNLSLQYHKDNNNNQYASWWELQENLAGPSVLHYEPNGDISIVPRVSFITFNDRIYTVPVLSGLKFYGLTALYILVMWTVGTKIKDKFFTENHTTLMFRGLDNVDPLLHLVETLYNMIKGEENLDEQRRLYQLLISLYADPVRMREFTKCPEN